MTAPTKPNDGGPETDWSRPVLPDIERGLEDLTRLRKDVEELQTALLTNPNDGGPAIDYSHMTLVFARDPRELDGNPFLTETPFGECVGVSAGNLVSENDRLEALLRQHGIDQTRPWRPTMAEREQGRQVLADIERGLEGVTGGPWEVFEGCSWRRIGSRHPDYADGAYDTAVLAPCRASDGHPDLTASSGDRDRNLSHIARCSPDNMQAVIDSFRALEAENARLREEMEDAIPFIAVWAAQWADKHGLPDGHLHPDHYDILERFGGIMDGFTRAALQGGQSDGE